MLQRGKLSMKRLITTIVLIIMACSAMAQDSIIYDTFTFKAPILLPTSDGHHMLTLMGGDEISLAMISFHTDTLEEGQLYSFEMTDSVHKLCYSSTRLYRYTTPAQDETERLSLQSCSFMMGRDSDSLQYVNITATTSELTFQLYYKDTPQEETPDTIVVTCPEAFHRVTPYLPNDIHEITYAQDGYHFYLKFYSNELAGTYRTNNFSDETALYANSTVLQAVETDSIYAEITLTDSARAEYHVNVFFYGTDGQIYNIITDIRQHVATDTVLLRADDIQIFNFERAFSFDFNNGDYLFTIFMEKTLHSTLTGHYTEFDFGALIPIMRDHHTDTPYSIDVATMNMAIDTDELAGGYLVDMQIVGTNDTCYHFQLTNRHGFDTDGEAQSDFVGHYTPAGGYGTMEERHHSLLYYTAEFDIDTTSVHLVFPYTRDEGFAVIENGTHIVTDCYYPFAPIADSSVVMASFGQRNGITMPSYIQRGDSIWYLVSGEVIIDSLSEYTKSVVINGMSASGHRIEFSFGITDVSIDDVTSSDYSIYPNPVSSVLHIEGDDVQRVMLYDLSGRLISESHGSEMDMSRLAAGLYLVKVQTSAGVKVEKIIKK